MEQLELFEQSVKDDRKKGLKEKKYGVQHLNFLIQEREWLNQNKDEGCECRVCGQNVKRYKRAFNSGMALVLIKLSDWIADHPSEPFCKVEDHLQEWGLSHSVRGDFHKARFWGLIEPDNDRRDDGSQRTGYWKLTKEGFDFVFERTTIPSHVYLYLNNEEGFTKEHISIRDALGTKFDYEALMYGQ